MAVAGKWSAGSTHAIFGQCDRGMPDAQGGLRQVTGLVASLLKLAKLDWLAPDYTTLCQRQKTLAVSL